MPSHTATLYQIAPLVLGMIILIGVPTACLFVDLPGDDQRFWYTRRHTSRGITIGAGIFDESPETLRVAR